MTPLERVLFVNSYTRTLVAAWSDEQYAALLQDDPRTALARTGVDVPADVAIEIVRSVPTGGGEGGVDIQVELYEQGLAAGRVEIRIPVIPRVDTVELSDDDLEAVHAGAVNCSCCPCCCCT